MTKPLRYRLLILALVALLATGSVFAVRLAARDNRAASEREQARYTICLAVERLKSVVRDDNLRRLKATQDFLKANPGGTNGLTIEVLQRSILNIEKTLDGLKPIDCVAFAQLDDEQLLEVPDE